MITRARAGRRKPAILNRNDANGLVSLFTAISGIMSLRLAYQVVKNGS